MIELQFVIYMNNIPEKVT